MKITFKDGNSFQATDGSTILDCVFVVKDFDEVNILKDEFTVENLTGVQLGDNTYDNIIPVNFSINGEYGENITVHFINREKTTEEIQNEIIDELQLSIAELSELIVASVGVE